jgi:hypothetical protein
MHQPTDNDMYANLSTHSDYTTHTYQHISQQHSTLDIHDTSVDSASNDVHSGSSLRDIASSDSTSSRAAVNIEAQSLADYLQACRQRDYLQPVDDEVYLQPVCGGREHCQAETCIQSVNFDNTSDSMQALNDLPGYTIHDSTNRFVSINYTGVQCNTAPAVQSTNEQSYYHEIADEQASVYDEINMDYQQARDVQAVASDNIAVNRQQHQSKEFCLQPRAINRDCHLT